MVENPTRKEMEDELIAIMREVEGKDINEAAFRRLDDEALARMVEKLKPLLEAGATYGGEFPPEFLEMMSEESTRSQADIKMRLDALKRRIGADSGEVVGQIYDGRSPEQIAAESGNAGGLSNSGAGQKPIYCALNPARSEDDLLTDEQLQRLETLRESPLVSDVLKLQQEKSLHITHTNTDQGLLVRYHLDDPSTEVDAHALWQFVVDLYAVGMEPWIRDVEMHDKDMAITFTEPAAEKVRAALASCPYEPKDKGTGVAIG